MASLDDPGIDPQAFAREIKRASDDELDELMAGERRDVVLRELFARCETHFRADRAKDLDAVLHFKLFDRPGGGYDHWEVVIRDGACSARQPASKDPTTTVKCKPSVFLKLITGNMDGRMAALRGRITVQGDLGLAARMSKLFELPKA